jgi:hypothetical protein
MKQVTMVEFAALSVQGVVAVAARCAMRVRQLVDGPKQPAIDRAIEVARRCSLQSEVSVFPASIDDADDAARASASAASYVSAACGARPAAEAATSAAFAAAAALRAGNSISANSAAVNVVVGFAIDAASASLRALVAGVNCLPDDAEAAVSAAVRADIHWVGLVPRVSEDFYDRDLWSGAFDPFSAARASVPLEMEVYIDRGEATSADVEEFLVALNELNISFGGQGFEFVTDGTALARQVQQ